MAAELTVPMKSMFAGSIKMIVPVAAGNGTDTVARLVAEQIEKDLNRNVVVINHPGAMTELATKDFLHDADPDTILFSNTYLITSYVKEPYDISTLLPIGNVATMPLFLVSETFETVADLKASKKHILYGAPGVGSPSAILQERVMKTYHLDGELVPYQGSQAIMVDLDAKRIDLTLLPYSVIIGHPIHVFANSGQIFWLALFGNKNTTPAFAKQIRDEINKFDSDRDFVQKLVKIGITPSISTTLKVEDQIDAWKHVLDNE